MARRYDHTRDEIRQMAITAGTLLIETSGFAKFSARRVAKEIGYSVGTLYNVFENYDELILRINAQTLTEIIEKMQKVLLHAQSPQKMLAQVSDLYINFAIDHFNRWSCLYEYRSVHQKVLPDWYLIKVNQLFKIIESILMMGLCKKQENAEQSAKVIWASVHGICQLSLSGRIDIVGRAADKINMLVGNFVDHYTAG